MKFELPHISSTEKSDIKIITNCGSVFYAHGLKESYSYIERKKVVSGLSAYIGTPKVNSLKGDAYCVLLWSLFGDYLRAYNFDYIRTGLEKGKSKKHLYAFRNSNGFIKIGVSKNIDVRLVDLKYEFDGDFHVLKVSEFSGQKERSLHRILSNHAVGVKKRCGNYSRECFEDCEEVLSIIGNVF